LLSCSDYYKIFCSLNLIITELQERMSKYSNYRKILYFYILLRLPNFYKEETPDFLKYIIELLEGRKEQQIRFINEPGTNINLNRLKFL
jgi:hypothetical protein